MDNFDNIINETVNYWLGKPNNPLTGKTFKEIYELSLKVGKENIK